MVIFDVAARFIVPHKHGFDKSNRYNKHIHNNYKFINVIKIDQNFYDILLKNYFLKVTNAYYI